MHNMTKSYRSLKISFIVIVKLLPDKIWFAKDSTQNIGMGACAELTVSVVVWMMLRQFWAPIYIFPDCICQLLLKVPHKKSAMKTINNCHFHIWKMTGLHSTRNNWNRIIGTIKSTMYLTILLKNKKHISLLYKYVKHIFKQNSEIQTKLPELILAATRKAWTNS